MTEKQIKTLREAWTICDEVSKAISKRNNGRNDCKRYCPGKEKLFDVIQDLIEAIQDVDLESSMLLAKELSKIKQTPKKRCIDPYSFVAIATIVDILKHKYIKENTNTRKIFISYSSLDEIIIKGFIKEILKIGCGFKDNDIFCTIDPSVIKTGVDFREKIVENMKECDFILLFISKSYLEREVCQLEMGASWALENKRILPIVLPNVTFPESGFLNEVKQGASIFEPTKLDEFYTEICDYYSITPNWPSFNKAKDDFLNLLT